MIKIKESSKLTKKLTLKYNNLKLVSKDVENMIFYGRENELKLLDNLYNSNKFELLVMYGRRRVGKTSILQKFAKDKDVLFYSAIEQNNTLNLNNFNRCIKDYFNLNYSFKLVDWQEAFNLLLDQINSCSIYKRITIIIDEFPFIAKEYPAIKSILQHLIDHHLKNKNVFLILCGSSVSFMINDELGYNSPLNGRRTSQIELKPFDYTITNEFYKNMSNLDKIYSYGILGGIPLYLASFSDTKSLKENIKSSILNSNHILYNEPLFLLRQELKEPLFYNSILTSIASGSTRLNEISSKTNEMSAKVSKYLDVLKEIRLVKRDIPYGEPINSKRGIYSLSDNYFNFWYKFIFENQAKIELLDEDIFLNELMENFNIPMGFAFENICKEYLINKAKENNLPFVPNGLGKWWGNNPNTKKQVDIDIIGFNKENGIFAECKFKNEVLKYSDYLKLKDNSEIFTFISNKYYYLFSKSGFDNQLIKLASEDNKIKLININDLFR